MTSWTNILNSQAPLYDADDDPDVVAPAPIDDGVFMSAGMKYANKCRQCSKTVDVGVPAWFNKDGDPGRKTTCQECHQKKVDALPPGAVAAAAEDAKNKLLEKTIAKKPRRLAPKFTPELLLDKDKGLTAVYKNFPKLKFKGKGHEAGDLRRLINKYAEWGQILVPGMEFTDFVEKLEKHSGNVRVRTKLEMIRNVQQGLCQLDDLDDYELADKGEHLYDEWEQAGGRPTDGLADWGDEDELPAAPPVELSDEQRERMEQNKRLALEKAAARRAAAGGATAGGADASQTQIPSESQITVDDEEMWDEIEAAGGGGFDAFDEEAEMDAGFDAFDEEAEADLFGFEAPAAVAAPKPAVPQPAMPAGGALGTAAAEAGPVDEADEDVIGAQLDEAIAQAEASQRAREDAQAAAEALEAGMDDDEEF
jgi:hypothetical protein